MNGLLGDYNSLLEKNNRQGKNLSDKTILSNIAELAVGQTIAFIEGMQKRSDYDFGNFIEGKYLSKLSMVNRIAN